MMSASEFKKRSNIRFHRRKSPIIQDIDKLLKEYEKSGSDNRKMKCLVYVYLMCKHYKHTKPTGRRGDAVTELLGQAKQELDSPAFKQKIAAKAGGLHYSGGKPTNAMSTSGATATGLSSGYTFEGILPQKNFVAKMHLNMESILGDNKYFGASLMSQKVEQELQDKQNMQADQSAQEAGRMMKTMPMSQALDYLHQMWLCEMDQGYFNYLNSAQRMKYLLTMKNRQLLSHSSGVAFDTGLDVSRQPAKAAYAMDTDERIYCLGAVSGVGINWNHSSLLSGHPVICAGEMIVVQGQLRHIDNNSGHYKPDTDNLADCVHALDSANVDLSGCNVFDKAKNQNHTAAVFLGLHP